MQEQSQANRQCQAKLEAAQGAVQDNQQRLWELERSNVQLTQQAAKQAEETDFLEGELAGLREHEIMLREQAAVQQEQASTTCCFCPELAWGQHQAPHRAVEMAYTEAPCPITARLIPSVEQHMGLHICPSRHARLWGTQTKSASNMHKVFQRQVQLVCLYVVVYQADGLSASEHAHVHSV